MLIGLYHDKEKVFLIIEMLHEWLGEYHVDWRVDPPTFHMLIGLYHEHFSITIKIYIFSLQQCYKHKKFLNLASHDKEIVFLIISLPVTHVTPWRSSTECILRHLLVELGRHLYTQKSKKLIPRKRRRDDLTQDNSRFLSSRSSAQRM